MTTQELYLCVFGPGDAVTVCRVPWEGAAPAAVLGSPAYEVRADRSVYCPVFARNGAAAARVLAWVRDRGGRCDPPEEFGGRVGNWHVPLLAAG